MGDGRSVGNNGLVLDARALNGFNAIKCQSSLCGGAHVSCIVYRCRWCFLCVSSTATGRQATQTESKMTAATIWRDRVHGDFLQNVQPAPSLHRMEQDGSAQHSRRDCAVTESYYFHCLTWHHMPHIFLWSFAFVLTI